MLLNALEMGICMRPTPALALGGLGFFFDAGGYSALGEGTRKTLEFFFRSF
jgi:hypothetical protein